VVNRVLKFADDTKLFGMVANEEDMNIMQNDLKNLFKDVREECDLGVIMQKDLKRSRYAYYGISNTLTLTVELLSSKFLCFMKLCSLN
jgi:hypothetical protein